MRTPLSMALLAALATLAGCGDHGTPAGSPETSSSPAAAPVQAANAPPSDAPTPIEGNTSGSLRVDAPAEGAITFLGFGQASFGSTEEEVRMAWGGDLGDAGPSEPGGCHYLVPQPVGTDGYRSAFMIEGDRFARIDVRGDDVTAPGGGKVGMASAEIQALYPGRIEEQPHKYSDGKYLRIKDATSGNALLFETDAAGKVTEWRVGKPPQVDYVEGCS